MAAKETIKVLTAYYRPKPGGLCKRLFRAIHALLAAGYEVHYLAVIPFPINHPRCVFHPFPWPRNRTDSVFFWACFHAIAPWMLLWIGLGNRITHSFAFNPTYALVLQPLRIFGGVPISLFARADTITNHRIKGRSSWLLALERMLEGIAISGVSLYGVSETLTKAILSRHRYLGPKYSGVLYNDIDVVRVSGQHVRTVSFPLRLSCVGVLEARKNQEHAICCIQGISKKKVHLNLYGIGPDETRLKVLIKEMGMENQVTLMGWCARETIWMNTDLLLFPSLHEGASNAILEAMSSEIPVLASDIPEHREMLPEELLLPLGDPGLWEQKINYLIADAECNLRNLIERQNSYKRKFEFDWDNSIIRNIVVGSAKNGIEKVN